MEKLRIRSMVLDRPPGGGADYSRIAGGLASLDGREIAPYAFLIERITRQLDIARGEHRYAKTVAALKRDAAVHIHGLDADIGAEQRHQVSEKYLAQMAFGTAVKRQLQHGSFAMRRTARWRSVARSIGRRKTDAASHAPSNAIPAPAAAARSESNSAAATAAPTSSAASGNP